MKGGRKGLGTEGCLITVLLMIISIQRLLMIISIQRLLMIIGIQRLLMIDR